MYFKYLGKRLLNFARNISLGIVLFLAGLIGLFATSEDAQRELANSIRAAEVQANHSEASLYAEPDVSTYRQVDYYEDKIPFKFGGRLTLVPKSQITYITIANRKAQIYTYDASEPVVSTQKLAEIRTKLNGSDSGQYYVGVIENGREAFLCTKRFIVNCNHVYKTLNNGVEFDNGDRAIGIPSDALRQLEYFLENRN